MSAAYAERGARAAAADGVARLLDLPLPAAARRAAVQDLPFRWLDQAGKNSPEGGFAATYRSG